MPGTFDTLFDDDEPMGAFGGYRPPYQNVVAVPASNRLGPGPVTPVTDATAASGANGDAAAPSVLTYPDGSPGMDINTGQPYPRPDRLNMQNNIATGQVLKRLADAPPGDIPNPNVMFAMLFPHGSLMDDQRPLGRQDGPFDQTNTNVSAYNFGVVGAAAGHDLEDLLRGAGSYNLWRGNPSPSPVEP
jgi:hypothetical protein